MAVATLLSTLLQAPPDSKVFFYGKGGDCVIIRERGEDIVSAWAPYRTWLEIDVRH